MSPGSRLRHFIKVAHASKHLPCGNPTVHLASPWHTSMHTTCWQRHGRERTPHYMRSRRPWLRRVSVPAVSAAVLLALASPAQATAPAAPAAPPTAVTAAPAAAAVVDYDTWQRDCRAVMDQA